MKKIFSSLVIFFIVFAVNAQTVDSTKFKSTDKPYLTEVEAACGQCQFGLKGKGCHLAVRIDNKAYYVDGSKLDAHGNVHAKDGLCNTIRKANVRGEVINNRFQASYFELLPSTKK